MVDLIKLAARINSANNQVNFQLKRNELPDDIKDRLPKLKGVAINVEDLIFGK